MDDTSSRGETFSIAVDSDTRYDVILDYRSHPYPHVRGQHFILLYISH